MKKLNLFLGLSALSLGVLFTSCNKDEDPAAAPVISFDQTSPVVLAAGVDSTVLTGTIKADGKLSSIKISKTVGTTESTLETITSFDEGDFTRNNFV